MATNLSGLFEGYVDPQVLQQKQQQQFTQNLMQSTDPRQFIATVGSNMGQQLAQGAQGLFGVKDKQQQLADILREASKIQDPVERARTAARLLAEAGLQREALMANEQADTAAASAAKAARDAETERLQQQRAIVGMQKDIWEMNKAAPGIKPTAEFAAMARQLGFPVQTNLNDYTPEQVAQINKALKKPDVVATPADFAATGLQLGIPVQTALSNYTQEQARQIRATQQAAKKALAEVGVGPDKITTVSTAQTVVERLVGKPKEALADLSNAKVMLEQVKGGNTTAIPTLRRALTKLVGSDSNLGTREVETILGSSGFASDAVGAFVKFLNGDLTQEKKANIEQMMNALEKELSTRYNNNVKAAQGIVNSTRLEDATKTSLMSAYPLWQSTSQKPAFAPTANQTNLLNKYLNPAPTR